MDESSILRSDAMLSWTSDQWYQQTTPRQAGVMNSRDEQRIVVREVEMSIGRL
jgi:hypothetical protein